MATDAVRRARLVLDRFEKRIGRSPSALNVGWLDYEDLMSEARTAYVYPLTNSAVVKLMLFGVPVRLALRSRGMKAL
jgi:hypothetical protein